MDGVDKFMHYNMSGNERWQTGPGLRNVTFENVKATGLLQPLTAYAEKNTALRMAMRQCAFAFRGQVPEFARGAGIGEWELEDVSIRDVEGPLLLNWQNREPTIRVKGLKGLKPIVQQAKETFSCQPI